MKNKRRRISNAVEILHRRFVKEKPQVLKQLEKERFNAEVAQKVYDLRQKSKLTQAQLAKLVGTTASVICRLEDSDYSGHSLSMLNRIAKALNSRLEVNFVPLKKQAA